MTWVVQKSTGSWYHLRNEDGEICEARLLGKFKLDSNKMTNPIAVGDHVEIEQVNQEDYVITEIKARENYVVRASPRKRGHFHLIAANVDQAMLVTSLRQPRTSLGFIDRFLVTLETFRIPGILIINKTDLYGQDDMEYAEALKWMYEQLGYPTLLASVIKGETKEIREVLGGKVTLISGHSGTGKSTLVNDLSGQASQDVKEVSGFSDKGVHTTTFAEMFKLDPTTFVIDTPGIKELGLAEVEPEELSHFFPEMRDLLGQCKFHNCLHVNEPGCVIQQAAEQGDISISRMDSYLSMLLGDDNRR